MPYALIYDSKIDSFLIASVVEMVKLIRTFQGWTFRGRMFHGWTFREQGVSWTGPFVDQMFCIPTFLGQTVPDQTFCGTTNDILAATCHLHLDDLSAYRHSF